jgi:hypothetical protein
MPITIKKAPIKKAIRRAVRGVVETEEQRATRIKARPHVVELILPVLGGAGSACGFRVFESHSWSLARDYADQHHMLTGQQFMVFMHGQVYTEHTYEGRYSPDFDLTVTNQIKEG